MKKILLLILTITVVGVYTSNAQLSSKEKKTLKKTMLKKMKAMDAEDMEAMYNEYPTMKGKVASLETKSKKAESELSDAKDKNVEHEEKISKLETEMEAFKNQALNSGGAAGAGARESGGGAIAGVVYKVQIGAFKNKDLSKYFENNKNFGGETDSDGTQKYTIGVFKEYWEADAFKKYMRQMGVKDAWIVAYKDGGRISMKDAREGK